MRDFKSKFPKEIDERLFLSDISISQVPLMQEYRFHLINNNYSIASELLNNSDVFYYGAWILNLFEDRLCNIGEFIMEEDEHSLITYNSCEPSQLTNTYDGMNWISDDDLVEFSNDYINIYDIHMHFGDTEPDNISEIFETWIENGNTDTTSIDKKDVAIFYQNEEPVTSNVENYNIWISD